MIFIDNKHEKNFRNLTIFFALIFSFNSFADWLDVEGKVKSINLYSSQDIVLVTLDNVSASNNLCDDS